MHRSDSQAVNVENDCDQDILPFCIARKLQNLKLITYILQIWPPRFTY